MNSYEKIVFLSNAIKNAQEEIKKIIEDELAEVSGIPFHFMGYEKGDDDEEETLFVNKDYTIIVVFSKENGDFKEADFYWTRKFDDSYKETCEKIVEKIKEHYKG